VVYFRITLFFEENSKQFQDIDKK